jgi:hypothetical protein
MIELARPLEFLEAIMNTFPKYFWGNYNNDTEAWIGIKSLAQVRFKCTLTVNMHLYINNEYKMSASYLPESPEGKRILQLIKEIRKYFAYPKNSSYQNFYSTILIKQSEQIIRYYFKEKEL